MSRFLWRTKAAGAAILALTLIGCSKKSEADAGVDPAATAEVAAPAADTTAPAAAPAATGSETLPGESAVRDSLAKKDYDTAVAQLIALRGAATGERYTAYMTLYGEVVDALRAEQSNPKANEAYAKLQMMTRGR